MFVDSSAFVSIVASEPDGKEIAGRLDHARSAITSPIAIFEAALALARIRQIRSLEAMGILMEFQTRAGISTVEVGCDAYLTALGAHARYGKGTGHPAQLNMGDCFAYAVAKAAGLPILYKGSDFALTDMA